MRRLLAFCACARALSPRELVAAHAAKRGAVEFAPRSRWAPDVRFSSAAGGFAGAAELAAAADFWSATEELEGFATATASVASVAPREVIVRWNATWTPDAARWLLAVAAAWPGVAATPTSYADRCRAVSSFSWRKVFELFRSAARTGELRVPLATVEGTTTLTFDDTGELRRVDEALFFADLLRRGQLQNRRCAADLRSFLEVCRRPPGTTADAWADAVAEALPWASVPGSGSLDIEPSDDGGGEVVAFAAVVVAGLAALSATIAPLLLGPSAPPDAAAYY